MTFRVLSSVLIAAAFAAYSPARAAIQNNQLNPTGPALICSGSPWIDVGCYGALGNGTHDDGPAIGTAITDAINGNFPIHFSAGTYKVTTKLTWDYAGIAGNGLQVISEGAIIDGRTITAGNVLQAICSGGTTGSPATCLHFRLQGNLTIWGSSTDYTVAIGKTDLSDIHSGMRFDGKLVAINSSTNAAAGGIQLNYVVGSDLLLDGSTSGGNASHGGVTLEQVQTSRLSGHGSASGASAPSMLFEGGLSRANTVSGFDYGQSATCLSLAVSTAQQNVFIAPYWSCALAVSAPSGIGSNVVVLPVYAGSTAGPNSGGLATIGRGSLNRYDEPAVSALTLYGVDDGRIISSKLASGPAAGWAAASLPVTLPDPGVVGAGWTMGFVTDNAKAVVLNTSTGQILSGAKAVSVMTLARGNYQIVIIKSDGVNFRLLYATPETLSYNGFTYPGFPSAWQYPGGPGYQATLADNGTTLSSGLASGLLTVTLPSTTTVSAGWTLGLAADGGNKVLLQVNATSGANILLPGGSLVTSTTVSSTFFVIQFDGANFRQIVDTAAVLDIRSFGAKCDNATDDFAAITAAIVSAVSNNVGAVVVPSLKCRSSGTILVPQFVKLQGTAAFLTNPPMGATIVCDLAVTPCVEVSGSSNSSGLANNAASLSDLIVSRAAGTIPLNSQGILVKGGYNVNFHDVMAYRHYDGWTWNNVCTTPPTGNCIWGISSHAQRIFSGVITGHHIVQNNWPELTIENSRFGMNGTGDLANESFVRITGGQGGGGQGPNTLVLTDDIFIHGSGSNPQYFIEWDNIFGAGINVGEIKISNSHIEAVTGADFASLDSSVNSITFVQIVNSTFNHPTVPVFALNSATQLANWNVTNSHFFCSTFDLSPNPVSGASFAGVSFVNNEIGCPAHITNNTDGSTVSFVANQHVGDLTLDGAGKWGALSVLGEQFLAGVINNSIAAGSNWQIAVPNNSRFDCSSSIGLAFGGSSTGIAYELKSCSYQVVGDEVTVSFNIKLTNKGAQTGLATIVGMPIKQSSAAYSVGAGTVPYTINLTSLTGAVSTAPSVGGGTILNLTQSSAIGTIGITDVNFTNTSQIAGTLTYPR